MPCPQFKGQTSYINFVHILRAHFLDCRPNVFMISLFPYSL
uniref:Uncharacterized protein n=1 Tax=Anguilla anguilla TaxID=7936 RepID=A0A0E9RNJ0_ANGAN